MFTLYVEFENIFLWGHASKLMSCLDSSTPHTERPHKRIQRRAPLLPFAPRSMFHAEGSCRRRPRNTSVCVSRQPWHQKQAKKYLCLCVQPALASAAPCASALDSSPTKCAAFSVCRFGAGGDSAELSGRLTASGSEPQRNCARSWSNYTHYTLQTSSRAISSGKIPQWNNYLRYHLSSPNSV